MELYIRAESRRPNFRTTVIQMIRFGTTTPRPISEMTPLAGLRVLDFSHVIVGPLATLYLAQ